jgi:prefoldin subunit 5
MSDDPKPPYVVFETRAVEDRTASLEAGHYVTRDVDFAIITPAGSRDRIEKEAVTWIEDLKEGARNERLPATWPSLYEQAFKAWKAGQEMPTEGTAVKDWPALSPSQVRTLLDMGINTVELVSDMNEEAVNRLGMGGRALKEKAKAWLIASATDGKAGAEIDSLRRKVEALTARAEKAEAENKELAQKLEALTEKA